MELKSTISQIRVSSVLNRDVKQFGKKHLMDGDDDTCWNSDQGSPQWVHVSFVSPQSLTGACIFVQFQGGFCGKDCTAEFYENGTPTSKFPFYPEDSNSGQKFEFAFPDEKQVTAVRLTFQKSTDFFGRVIVYKLDLEGL